MALGLMANVSLAQNISPDSTKLALKRLNEIKQELKKSNQVSAESIDKMLSLGMWDDAFKAISTHKKPTPAIELLSADYFMLNNNFKPAEQIVNKILKQDPKNEKAVSLLVALKVQAWLLPEAASICEQFLKTKSSEKNS